MSKKEEKLISMSLGDHLDELRKRLLLALIGLAVGLAACLGFGQQLLGVINWPFEQAKTKYIMEQQQKEVVDQQKDSIKTETSESSEKNTSESSSPEENIEPAKTPLDSLTEIEEPKLYAHHPTEKVMVYFKTCILFGIILSSPWLLYQMWAFVSAGLYQKEKTFVYRVLPVSIMLFATGALFFLLVIAPMVMLFLMKFDIGLNAANQWRLRDYINMITVLTLVFGAAFQLPIIIVMAEKVGLVTIQALTSFRKYVLLVLFVLAAILTPPDVVSQISLAVPLYILYEASIIVCRLLNVKKSK